MNFSQLQGERYKRLPMAAQIISDCKVMQRLQGYRGNWSLKSLLASKRQAMRESLPVWTRLYFFLNLWSFSGLVSVLNSWFLFVSLPILNSSSWVFKFPLFNPVALLPLQILFSVCLLIAVQFHLFHLLMLSMFSVFYPYTLLDS